MIIKPYIVNKEHKSPYSETYFETTYWHDIGSGVKWRQVKHWGSGVYGAEGRLESHGDRSGCVKLDGYPQSISVPIVVEQRHYKQGKYLISAVFSYPYGLSLVDEYFWEVCSIGRKEAFDDIERFSGDNAEKKMEKWIIKRIGKK